MIELKSEIETLAGAGEKEREKVRGRKIFSEIPVMMILQLVSELSFSMSSFIYMATTTTK
jgi:hypothetical protein